ncbi:MAG: RAMP superfamily CRISPR-associated protein [Nostoc sp.]|uniref:RAMP superfamily CRISPR-associated protein n=1 Tax=Nostoc sp. TaxID=1180 RepID=UPI002FF7727F
MPRNYNFISLPQQKPDRLNILGNEGKDKFGHDKYQLNNQRFSGKLFLSLIVVSPVSVNSGITVMGSDLAQQTLDATSAKYVATISLIQSSVQQNQRLIIPGSSLKGVVRSIYEAITRSCLCKTNATVPDGYSECKDTSQLCPACVTFGAMSWLGLVHFHDAKYDPDNDKPGFQTGLITPLFSPKPEAVDLETGEKVYYDKNNNIRGRKFYPHSYEEEVKPTIRIQQAELGKKFTTYVTYANLTKAQLGTLLIALGQDPENRLGLKIGSGKAVGMGTIKIDVVKIEQLNINRYLSYNSNSSALEGNQLQTFILDAIQSAKPQPEPKQSTNQPKKPIKKSANQALVQLKQLQELKEILNI